MMTRHRVISVLALFSFAAVVVVASFGSWFVRCYHIMVYGRPAVLDYSTGREVPAAVEMVRRGLSGPAGQVPVAADSVERLLSDPPRELSDERVRLSLVGLRRDRWCRNALWGEKLRESVDYAACSRSWSVLYRTGDGRLSQVTFFRVGGVSGAVKMVDLLSRPGRSGFVRTLQAKDPSSHIGGHGASRSYIDYRDSLVAVIWTDGRNADENTAMYLASRELIARLAE